MNGEGAIEGRFAGGCIACGGKRLRKEWTVISSFFAERALLGKPQVIALFKCCECGTQHFDFLATDEQLARLYCGYRGEEYFRQRHAFEPWYTAGINSGMGGEIGMSKRREALKRALAQAAVHSHFRGVLDHGGDRGQMLSDLSAERKAVYEISGVSGESGIESIGEEEMRAAKWDLILSCHVLEHQSCPAALVSDLVSLGHPGTVYFIEVPNESVASRRINSTDLQRYWLGWLIERPLLFKWFDFLATGVRSRLGLTLPFLFVPLREHLTFFTVEGLQALLTDAGLTVLFATILRTGHIGVVAVKQRILSA